MVLVSTSFIYSQISLFTSATIPHAKAHETQHKEGGNNIKTTINLTDTSVRHHIDTSNCTPLQVVLNTSPTQWGEGENVLGNVSCATNSNITRLTLLKTQTEYTIQILRECFFFTLLQTDGNRGVPVGGSVVSTQHCCSNQTGSLEHRKTCIVLEL